MLAFGYFIQFQLRYLLCLCKGNVIQTTIYRLHLLYNNFKFVWGFPCRKTVETKQVQSPWEVSDCSTRYYYYQRFKSYKKHATACAEIQIIFTYYPAKFCDMGGGGNPRKIRLHYTETLCIVYSTVLVQCTCW